ncbi:MAG TPA: hypothetical protein VEB66_12340 [Opitutaceae bacterium]|nr:hypothetical protein [Opitutaceae bacterium]
MGILASLLGAVSNDPAVDWPRQPNSATPAVHRQGRVKRWSFFPSEDGA